MKLYMEIKKSLSERIKQQMSAKSLSSIWLADAIGVTPVSISNILTGKSAPSVDNLMKIAKALEVKVSYLLGEDEATYSEETEKENSVCCPHCGKPLFIVGDK